MDNFYTVTVYEKGSEVVRMYATLLGKEGFRKGGWRSRVRVELKATCLLDGEGRRGSCWCSAGQEWLPEG